MRVVSNTSPVSNLAVIGRLGILQKEKQEGRIPSLLDEIDKLTVEAGFFISAKVRQAFLSASGEG